MLRDADCVRDSIELSVSGGTTGKEVSGRYNRFIGVTLG